MMSKNDSQKTKRFGTNLILTGTIFLIAYAGIRYAYSPFITLLMEFVLIALSAMLVLSIRKEGLGPTAITILGCSTLILIGLVPYYISANQIPDMISFKTKPILEPISSIENDIIMFKEYIVFLTLFDFGIGLSLAYRPTFLYVRNRIPDESDYPLWESKNQPMTRFSPNLVPLKSLLSEKDKWIIFRYKFVLVSIDEKIYRVKPDDNVPETTFVLRTKSGQSPLGI